MQDGRTKGRESRGEGILIFVLLLRDPGPKLLLRSVEKAKAEGQEVGMIAHGRRYKMVRRDNKSRLQGILRACLGWV